MAEIVGQRNLLVGDAISEAYTHDEALTATPQKPAYVAKPATPDEVAALLRFATEHRVPVTARGSGCGVSGAAQPVEGGLLVSFERMNAVLEVDGVDEFLDDPKGLGRRLRHVVAGCDLRRHR